MEKRTAAYVLFFIAGTATASLAWVLLDGLGRLVRIITLPFWDDLALIAMAGAAAATAAWAVHAPFLRAARARRRLALYGWTLLGVLASHAAYVALVFLHSFLIGQFPSLGASMSLALLTGLVALVMGFFPNMLFGICFAEALLWQDKRPLAACPQTGA